jgi:hypothetical protein
MGRRPIRSRLLSVGRAVEKKGYDVLLKALSLLPKDLHWRFDHIGGGDRLAGSEGACGKPGHCRSRLPGKAHGAGGCAGALSEADLFALACRIAADGDRDGLPNVLVEASSQRLPCISTDVSGVPELISDGENGCWFHPEDPAALAVALERAIRDPALRHSLGAAAERRVREHFDYHSSIRQLSRLFEEEWQKDSELAEIGMSAPRVFFYVQHLLGIGHIARASPDRERTGARRMRGDPRHRRPARRRLSGKRCDLDRAAAGRCRLLRLFGAGAQGWNAGRSAISG